MFRKLLKNIAMSMFFCFMVFFVCQSVSAKRMLVRIEEVKVIRNINGEEYNSILRWNSNLYGDMTTDNIGLARRSIGDLFSRYATKIIEIGNYFIKRKASYPDGVAIVTSCRLNQGNKMHPDVEFNISIYNAHPIVFDGIRGQVVNILEKFGFANRLSF